MRELPLLTATEALARFGAHDLSPVELMEAVIARAEELEPRINAFTDTYYEEAIASARAAEARWAAGTARPLEGLPVAVKCSTPIAGQPSTSSSLVFAERVAEVTAPAVQRILDAGGIVHARTSSPEFGCAPFTHSKLYGVTRNPWNLERSPGGSSGGAGAALAAGTTLLADGSDIGGSIRIPAASCGVIGYKPPHGRVPLGGVAGLDLYCHLGPLARTVEDTALLHEVMAGPHPWDMLSLPPMEAPRAPFAEPRDLRVGLSVTLGGYRVEPEVAEATRAAAAALATAGVEVVELDPAWDPADIALASQIHYGALFAAEIAPLLERRDELTPYAVDFIERTMPVAAEHGYVRALELAATAHRALVALFEQVDVLLCPTLPLTAFAAGEDYVETPVTVGGVAMEDPLTGLTTVPFNVCSRHPAMSVPSGRGSDGVPIGLQIVGRPHDELSVFRIAAAVERLLDSRISPRRGAVMSWQTV